MPWNSDGTYTWGKSGETMSATQMKSDYNMTPPSPKKSNTPTPQSTSTPQSSSPRTGMQPDGTYVTPSGLVFPKEYAAGVAAGRPYRIDQSGGSMTVSWQDENPFTPTTNIQKAGSAGQAQLQQKSMDPSVEFQDQSGKTFATISSPNQDMSDVQVSRIFMDKSGNEYATITSSIAGGTKLEMKQLPQIGSGNVFLASRPIFEKDPDPKQTKAMMDNMLYKQSIPDYKPLTSNIPGIGYVTGLPDFIESKYPSILKDNPVGYASGKAVKGFAGIPSGLIGMADTFERYGRVALDQPATGQFTIAKMLSPNIQKQEAEKYTKPMNLPQIMAYESGQVVSAAKSDPLGFTAEVVGSMLIAGGVTKLVGRASGVVRTLGREPIPIKKIGYRPEVGYPINPTPSSAKNVLKSFEDNTLFPKPKRMSKQDVVPYTPQNAVLPNTQLTGSQRLMYTGWETDVPVGVGKKYIVPTVTSSETSGIYGAPVAQTSYTKISSKMTEAIKNISFGADFSFGLTKKPTVVATIVDSIAPVPKSLRNKIGSKEFIETKSKPGVAYADLYKSEYQVILGSGQEVAVTGKNYYTKYGGIGESNFLGRRIPITEQKTTGRISYDDINVYKSNINPIKSKSGSSDIYRDPYRINVAINNPTTYKSSKSTTSSPTYKTTDYTLSSKSNNKMSLSSIIGSNSVGKSTSKSSSGKMSMSSIIGSTSKYSSSVNTSKSSTTKSSTSSISNISTPFKSSKSNISSYAPTDMRYTPYKSSSTPISSKSSTSITTITSTPTYKTPTYKTPTYKTPTYKTPSYKPPAYSLPKFKISEEKQKKIKSKPIDLFGFKERTKSRSAKSILGGDMFKIKAPSRKKPVLTKNKPRISKKKIVRRSK